jgi:disulfide oxidoreductase YuzD
VSFSFSPVILQNRREEEIKRQTYGNIPFEQDYIHITNERITPAYHKEITSRLVSREEERNPLGGRRIK